MSYEVRWYVEGKVVYARLPETLTLEQVHELNDEMLTYFEQTASMVHAVIDATQLSKFPLNVMSLRKASRIFDQPNFGWLIAISTNPVVNFIASILPQMVTKTRNRTVRSFEEGITFLQGQDHSIDWSAAVDT